MLDDKAQIEADIAAVAGALKATSDDPELPDPESFGPLKTARENVAKIESDLAAAKARRKELGEALGVKAKIDPAKFDKIAAELIASGKPADQIEAFESATKAVRRLQAAREVAVVKADEAYQRAVAAAEPMIGAYLAPADREIALAHVELCRAERKRAARVAELRRAGFLRHVAASGPQTYSGDAYSLREYWVGLVQRGVLTAEDVADLID